MTAAATGARPRTSPLSRLLAMSIVPLVAVLGALIVGGIIIFLSSFATGEPDPTLPFQAYASLFKGAFGSMRGILFSIVTAAPLILGGLAVGLLIRTVGPHDARPYRPGVFTRLLRREPRP